MLIPKLAKGGIIKNELVNNYNNYEEFEPRIVFPLNDEFYKIYKRTKKRRIKNKNMKKSFRAMIEENMKSINKKVGLSININGRYIIRE